MRVMLDGDSVFLTGPPGSGKTYVLNEYIRLAGGRKNIAITASTGIAATNIGGTTIHSWSGLGIRDQLTSRDREYLLNAEHLEARYKGADVLVIDEVSMLHGHRLNMVNEMCKLMRENDAPFGGLQVILVGDLFQLPPVSRGTDEMDFVHNSDSWAELKPKICYLSEQHRQVGDSLLDLLQAMRDGEISDEQAAALEARLHTKPDPTKIITRLYAHNVDVDTINYEKLSKVSGEAKDFIMQTNGRPAKVKQLISSVLAPETLTLKVGAEVMFVANNYSKGFVNGTRGKVSGFRDNLPIVTLQDGRHLRVDPHSWTMREDDVVLAEVIQLPLRLAWAITIHKSQGMSLDAAEIDLSKTFTSGMGYVALSRVRSMDGVYLAGINRLALTMHADIYEFDRYLQKESAVLERIVIDEPEEEVKTIKSPNVESSVDDDLLQKLIAWRKQRSVTDHVPAYIVAHNSLLKAIASHRPTSAIELLGIKGISDKKFSKYGPELMQILGIKDEEEITSADKLSAKGRQWRYGGDDKAWKREDERKLRDMLEKHVPLEEVAEAMGRRPEDLWWHLSTQLYPLEESSKIKRS